MAASRRRYYLALWALAAALLAAFLLGGGTLDGLSAGFPFTSLASLLRALSLSGAAGNAAAVALYILVCALPLLLWALARKRRGAGPEDALLLALCPALLLALYYMINPARLVASFASARMGCLAWAVLIWALLLTWAALRLLRLFRGADGPGLLRCAGGMVKLLGACFLLAALFALLWDTAADTAALREGNTDGGGGLTWLFLLARGAARALPSALSLAACLRALDVVEALGEGGELTEACVAAAERLAAFCARALTISLLVSLVMIVLQVLMAPLLRSIAIELQLPFVQAAVVLAALLAARAVAAHKRLSDDNDLFI